MNGEVPPPPETPEVTEGIAQEAVDKAATEVGDNDISEKFSESRESAESNIDEGVELSEKEGEEKGGESSESEGTEERSETREGREYKDPIEGKDFKYGTDPDNWAETDPKTGEISLNEELKDMPPEERIPHYEHEKNHQETIEKGEDPYTFESEYNARNAQADAWKDLKNPGQESVTGNDENYNLIYDKNGESNPKDHVRDKLEREYGYDYFTD